MKWLKILTQLPEIIRRLIKLESALNNVYNEAKDVVDPTSKLGKAITSAQDEADWLIDLSKGKEL